LCLKKKKRKGSHSYLSAQPAHRPTYLTSTAARVPPSFLFPAAADTVTPRVGAPSPSSLPFPFLCSPDRAPQRPLLHPAASFPFPFQSRIPIKAINSPLSISGRFSLSLALRPDDPLMASCRPTCLLVSPPVSFCPYLSSNLSSRPPLCTLIAPTHARAPHSPSPPPQFRHCRQWSTHHR
jgi:hypothetical protein